MKNNDQELKPANQKQTMWIMWGALLFSSLSFLGIGLFVPGQPGFKTAGEYQMLLVPLFVLALLQTGFVVVFWRKLLKPSNHRKLVFFVPFIVRMAVSESIGIFGLVLRFLGAPQEYLFIFVGWCILLQLTLAPTENAIQHFKRTYSKA